MPALRMYWRVRVICCPALLTLLLCVPADPAGAAARAVYPHHHSKPPARRVQRAGAAIQTINRATTGPSQQLFAPGSVWNRPLADAVALDPASAPMAAGLRTEVARELQLRIGPWIETSANSTPIYRVGPNQPTVRVQLDDPTAPWRVSLQSAVAAVPIPANAQPAAGSDAHMTIWQTSSDTLWEFWHARKLADGWHAAFGGAIQHVSQSPGYYTTSSWPGALSVWGATATSLPVAAGTITLDEIQRGSIDHALAIDLPYPRAGVWSWPAQRSDGTGTGIDPNAIPEGAHLRLDPALNLDALHLPPLVLMMARAAQKYGMVVRDQTHHAIGFFIEDPTPTGTDPFYVAGRPRTDGPFQGQWPIDLLRRFPWSAVQVLTMELHGPGSH